MLTWHPHDANTCNNANKLRCKNRGHNLNVVRLEVRLETWEQDIGQIIIVRSLALVRWLSKHSAGHY